MKGFVSLITWFTYVINIIVKNSFKKFSTAHIAAAAA